ncbi:GTP 3',8-cyclase MoaA [Christensenellaceae bacterium OttesenSCG-928-M15]|nr:GTP 3',8-cyclase MoaA [Christensenellaceae bacterium OttesenSCG-928-M15]
MLDQMGRNIHYLRLSLTERCTLKCEYCRAGEGNCPKNKELTAADFQRIVRVMAGFGIKKIRLTGGEPLLRRDIIEIIAFLSATEGIEEIAMTTNAQQLPGNAKALKAAGLTRLNISLDSLDPKKYRSMTGGGELQRVLDGIEEAVEVGLLPVKVNAVLMRGRNDDEIDRFIDLAKDKPLDMRFIELMPMGENLDLSMRVTTDEVLSARPWLKPIPPRYKGQPSMDYMVEGYQGRIGFISPMSHKFCGDCNRVRVMSDGMLRPCLGDNAEISLLSALKETTDDLLKETISNAIYHKPFSHHFDDAAYGSKKNMSQIGG